MKVYGGTTCPICHEDDVSKLITDSCSRNGIHNASFLVLIRLKVISFALIATLRLTVVVKPSLLHAIVVFTYD